MNSHERLQAHLKGSPVDRLPLMPITMMFAADQAGVKYGEYARDHRVLVAAQLLVAERFEFDYVSAISDPAREAADCGAEVQHFEDQPPAILEDRCLLSQKEHLASLKAPDPLGGGRMQDRVEAIALFRDKVGGQKYIEGWVEGPCAEAADLRGADILGVGDAAASLVGPKIYEDLVWPFEKRLVDGIHGMGGQVRLHICGKTRAILSGMGRLGCEIVDLDYPSPIDEGRSQMGPSQVLLGNIESIDQFL